MKKYLLVILSVLFLTSCGDCIQNAMGVILDKQTQQPIEQVAIGKSEKEDVQNPYTRKQYSSKDGKFDYHRISGGFINCPALVLFFSKKGYKTSKITFKSFSQNTTVLLEKIESNEDVSVKK